MPATHSKCESSAGLRKRASRGSVASCELYLIVVPDGRSCKLCGKKDSEIDPVAVAIGEQYTRVWAYPPKQAKDGTYHNEGCYCAYCVRVWQSRFKHTFTLAELVVKIGSCSETYERLDKLLKVCIDACVKAGSRSIRIDWSEHDKVQTKVKEIRSTSFCAPEDKFYEYAYYLKTFGNPSSKGHKVMTIEGVRGVLVPGEPVYTIKRRKTQSLEAETEVPDLVPLDEAEASARFNEIADSFMNIQATGRSLDELLGSRPISTASASASAQPAQGSASDSPAPSAASGLLRRSFSFTAIEEDAPQQEEDEQKLGNRRQRPSSKAKAKAQPAAGPETPKRNTGGGGVADSGSKGRPKRDLEKTMRSAIEGFQASSADDNYFGPENKTVRRFLDRLLVDVDKKMEATKDVAEFNTLCPLRKQLFAIVTVLKVYFTSGLTSVLFAEAFDSQAHFLSLDPPADLPFPVFWVAARYEAKCSSVEIPEAFWAMISKDQLAQHGLSDAPDAQITLVAERIVSIQKKAQKVSETLQALAQAMPSNPEAFEVAVSEQIAFVRLLVLPSSDPDAVLEAAEKTSDASLKVVSSLVAFPRGRALVEAAKSNAMTRRADSHKNQKLSGLLAEAQRVLSTCPKPSELWLDVGALDAVDEAFASICDFLKLDAPAMEEVKGDNLQALDSIRSSWISVCVSGWRATFGDLCKFNVSFSDVVQQRQAISFKERTCNFLGLSIFQSRWCAGDMDHVSVLRELDKFTRAVFDMPGLIDLVNEHEDLSVEDASQVQTIAGFQSLQAGGLVAQAIGDEAFKDLQSFSERFLVENTKIAECVKSIFHSQGSAKFEKVVEVWTGVFAQQPVKDIHVLDASPDLGRVEQISNVHLESEYIADLLDFAERSQDRKLRNQISFVATLLLASAALAKFYLPLAKMEPGSRDATKLTEERASEMHDLMEKTRALTDLEKAFGEEALRNLWVAKQGAIHYTILDGFLEDPMATIECLKLQTDELVDRCAKVWLDDLESLTTLVCSWCPRAGAQRHLDGECRRPNSAAH